MNVYAIEGRGIFGCGVAIVAADSETEAVATAATIHDHMWNTDYGRPTNVRALDGVHASRVAGARVLYHFEHGE